MYVLYNDGYHPKVSDFFNGLEQFPTVATFPFRIIEKQDKHPFSLRISDRYHAKTYEMNEGLQQMFVAKPTQDDFYEALRNIHMAELKASAELRRVLEFSIEDKQVFDSVMQNLTDVGNYYKLSQAGDNVPIVEYAPSAKYTRLLTEWPTNIRMNRNLTSVVRFALNRTDLKISDADLEEIATKMKAYFIDSKLEIVEISGEEIKDVYHYGSFHETADLGDMRNSCMRYDECQSFFTLYTNNPNTISMLVARYRGRGVVGRCLVWKLMNGEKAIDRIYGSGPTQKLIAAKAKELGYKDRDYLASREGMAYVENYEQKKWPFLDTMHFSDPTTQIFYSSKSYDSQYLDLESHGMRFHRVPNGGWNRA